MTNGPQKWPVSFINLKCFLGKRELGGWAIILKKCLSKEGDLSLYIQVGQFGSSSHVLHLRHFGADHSSSRPIFYMPLSLSRCYQEYRPCAEASGSLPLKFGTHLSDPQRRQVTDAVKSEYFTKVLPRISGSWLTPDPWLPFALPISIAQAGPYRICH